MKKKLISAILAAVLAIGAIPAMAEDLPTEFWGLNEKYGAALKNGNHAQTAQYGGAIVDLILKEPANDQNSNIIGSRAYEAAFAYYFIGDYANAVKYFKIYIPYGIEQNWPDGVYIAEQFIKQLTPSLEVYKMTTDEQKYFGVKNEPHGVLYGQVGETSQKEESMVLLYLEYGNVANFDWARVVLDKAKAEKKGVELALNFMNEGNDVRKVSKNDGYLASLLKFLDNYRDLPIYLRIGAEMNIWGTMSTPDEFKTAFRTIATYMRSLPNVATVWSVAHTSRWKSAEWPHTMHDFYPGDEYVDWVGVNAYPNKYFNGQVWSGVERFNEICFKTGYSADPVLMIKEVVDEYGDRKPIMISECGSAYKTNGSLGEVHGTWAADKLREMYAFIPMVYPQVKIMAYFNKNISHEYNYYELSGSSELAAAYDEMTQSPWFVQGASTGRAQAFFAKSDGTITTEGNLNICTYPHLYGADSITVDYYVDGQWKASSKTPPYRADLSGIKGNHKLHVVATGSNGSVMERDYTISSSSKATGAADFSDTSSLSSAQKDAVDYAVSEGIMTGYDDGTIRPENTITRAEFATMICRLMNYTSDTLCTFNDAVGHWGSKYIDACVKAGAINGVGGNNFEPDADITLEQAIKIVAVASGMADGSESYPDGFIDVAKKNGALKNLTSTQKGIPLIRIDAAMLMYNAVNG